MNRKYEIMDTKMNEGNEAGKGRGSRYGQERWI
jgi:hypothetical protein